MNEYNEGLNNYSNVKSTKELLEFMENIKYGIYGTYIMIEMQIIIPKNKKNIYKCRWNSYLMR